MKARVRAIAIVYFVLMAVAVTFPGMTAFNRIRPLVLGLPFAFAWVLGWVAVSTGVFYMLYRAYDE